MPPKSPPSFGSQEYWNTRFESDKTPFEWLESPNSLDSPIAEALRLAKDGLPEILHIGCGTSLLSSHLRTHARNPKQIHNLDYSDIAVELGRTNEKENYDKPNEENQNLGGHMRWHVVDLLDHTSLIKACQPNAYTVIVDKSTSDAIACSEDVHLPLPYPVSADPYAPIDLENRTSSEPVHPLNVLAVHLALVAKPGARWIALSYSDDRFPFLNELPRDSTLYNSFPDPSSLWTLVDKRADEASEPDTPAKNPNGAIVHKAKVFNYLYILERTKVPLFVRGDHV
ncbi:hypothetical protein IQ07DRAFT_423414 [Pyrenochaeta sp. DS3sAY3a]|nr:hypothetical protein IQ07DRAFT_423414 [Pyrenochaeta sp. DS3sAY3a]